MGLGLLSCLLAAVFLPAHAGAGAAQSEACINPNCADGPVSTKGSSVLQARSKPANLGDLTEDDEDEAPVQQRKVEDKKASKNKKKVRKVKGSSLVQVTERGQTIKAAVLEDEELSNDEKRQAAQEEGKMSAEEEQMIQRIIAEAEAKGLRPMNEAKQEPPEHINVMMVELERAEAGYTPNRTFPAWRDDADDQAMEQALLQGKDNTEPALNTHEPDEPDDDANDDADPDAEEKSLDIGGQDKEASAATTSPHPEAAEDPVSTKEEKKFMDEVAKLAEENMTDEEKKEEETYKGQQAAEWTPPNDKYH